MTKLTKTEPLQRIFAWILPATKARVKGSAALRNMTIECWVDEAIREKLEREAVK